MAITSGLAGLALQACHMCAPAAAARFADYLADRLTDHGAALPQAVAKANKRAWEAVRAALSPKGWLDVAKARDATGLEDDLRRFFATAPEFGAVTSAVRAQAVREAERRAEVRQAEGRQAEKQPREAERPREQREAERRREKQEEWRREAERRREELEKRQREERQREEREEREKRQREAERRLELTIAPTRGKAVPMHFALVPDGKYSMGSPAAEALRDTNEPDRIKVTIPAPFYLSVGPVTRGQFRAFAAATGLRRPAGRPHWEDPGFAQDDTHPVGVSWADAVAYCDWVEQTTGRAARLPTEAEWEWACRARTETAFALGRAPLKGKLNCDGRRAYPGGTPGEFARGTRPVGLWKNAWGLDDMHGQVWEWCGNDFDAEPGAVGPTARTAGRSDRKAVRGGAWDEPADRCRSAARDGRLALSRFANVGFRVLLPG